MHQNLRKNQNFSILLSESDTNTSHTITKANIPGLVVGSAEFITNKKTVQVPGNSIDESDLTFSVLLDDKFENYLFYRNWLKRIPFYDTEEGTLPDELAFKDISLTLYNNKNQPTIKFIYKNCLPESISDIDLDTTLNDDTDVISFDVTVNFRELEITHDGLL